jgi:hypothetical protein
LDPTKEDNGGILYVRRNKTPIWSGNSRQNNHALVNAKH